MQILVDREALEEIKAIQQEILSRLGSGREEDDLITVEKAAKFAGMEKQTIYKMFNSGKLPGKRFGRAIRVSRKALLACRDRDTNL